MSISRKKWPIIVRYSLGILGYVKRKNSNNFRRCLPCLLKHKGLENLHKMYEVKNVTVNEATNDYWTSCSICGDLNDPWRDRGSKEDDLRKSTFSEKTPLIHPCQYQRLANRVNIHMKGSTSCGNKSKWFSPMQWSLSLTWLVIITCLILGDWSVRLISSWGKRDHTLHLLSATTYVIPLVAVASMRILSMVYEMVPPTKNWWVYALTKGNVVTRLNMLDLSRHTGFGYLSVAFALLCACFELSNQFYLFSNCPDLIADNVLVKYFVDLVAFIIGNFMFAAFCYEVHLLKRCLQSDMKLCLSFVKRNIENGLDLCRQRILTTYSEFLKLHSLVSSWLVFQFSISVFKLSCHIYWNYNVFVVHTNEIPAILINIVIWCESTMFLLLPTFAVGGFSISYLLDDFKLDCKRMQRKKDGENWHGVARLLKTLNVTESGIYLTVFLSILSVFSALHLGSQYAEYWRENIANITCESSSYI
ncbi:uncharacterized protein [Ptychodera flava]